MKKNLLQILKWTWLAIVIGSVLFYLSKNFASVIEHAKEVSLVSIFFSMVFLIIGRILLSISSKWSVAGQDWRPSFFKMLHINSVTQLAKYLPGGVWHFVGKFSLYKANGMNALQTSRTMLVENLWLLLSAIYFGLITSFLGHSNAIVSWIDFPNIPFSKGTLSIFLVFTWIIALVLIEYFLKLKKQLNLWYLIRLIGLQATVWLFLGLSFWVILPNNGNLEFTITAIGGFAFSWAIGFATVFAPGGIGVRELTLTALLASEIISEEAAVFSSIHRLIWVLTELGLGVFTELLSGSLKINSFLRKNNPQK